MKKFILSAAAAGALAFGGAASAQSLGDILGNILGYGPGYGYNNGVVVQPHGTVYVDQYGRQVQVDQYGRHVLVQPGVVAGGGYNYITGRPNYNAYGNYAYAGRPGDRDGDGVANIHDRWPDDGRYR